MLAYIVTQTNKHTHIYLENQPVQLRNARLITDRATGTSRGYGYVEFDHPQELIAFISTINPQLCGRNIKVDIATGTPREDSRGGGGNNRRRSENRNNSGRRESNRGSRGGGGGGGELDRRGSERRQQSQKDELPKDVGTQFRGGMYVRSDSGGGRAGGGALRRNDSSASQGSGIGGVAAGGDASARQRPSLKLAPRTKPLENTEGGSTSQSSIFGGAKPRDESKFLEKKQSDLNVEDVAIKEATSSMGSMDVNKNEAGDARKNSNETADTKRNEQSDKQTPRRQDSKAGGRGGGKKESNGRRDITRKSGRGGGGERGSVGGSGRGEKNRGRGEGGRNGKRNSTKSYADNNGVSSLAAAASAGSSSPTPPVMPVKTEPTKVPPKKSNSFAAFMDDSDED